MFRGIRDGDRQSGRVAAALGAVEVPQNTTELAQMIAEYRPELEATPAAIDTARFLLKEPPLPWFAKPGYDLLASGAIALLPDWARAELNIGGPLNRAVGPVAGTIATSAVRWSMGDERRRRLAGFSGH